MDSKRSSVFQVLSKATEKGCVWGGRGMGDDNHSQRLCFIMDQRSFGIGICVCMWKKKIEGILLETMDKE